MAEILVALPRNAPPAERAPAAHAWAKRVVTSVDLVECRHPEVLVIGEVGARVVADRLTARGATVFQVADPAAAVVCMQERSFDAVVIEPDAGGEGCGVHFVGLLRNAITPELWWLRVRHARTLLVITPIAGDREFAVLPPGSGALLLDVAAASIEHIVMAFLSDRT